MRGIIIFLVSLCVPVSSQGLSLKDLLNPDLADPLTVELNAEAVLDCRGQILQAPAGASGSGSSGSFPCNANTDSQLSDKSEAIEELLTSQGFDASQACLGSCAASSNDCVPIGLVSVPGGFTVHSPSPTGGSDPDGNALCAYGWSSSSSGGQKKVKTLCECIEC